MNNKFESTSFILIFAGLGCFLFSLIAMGLAPWTTLRNVTEPVAQKIQNPYQDETGAATSIGRGRDLYLKEGCWHCHSQFVRPVAGEPYRYGPPSQAWESMYDVPHSYGTRRVGPDLSREAGRRSDDWHLAHFYNPRFVVPESIMPGYPWFFEEQEGKVVPKQEAKDLVAYMQYLGSAYREQIQAIVHPSEFKVSGRPLLAEVDLRRGEELFAQNCTGCHGVSGDGFGPAQPFLAPPPANLKDRYIDTSEAYVILNRGVLGSSMPSFREMPERDLWSIAYYVSNLGQDTKERFLKNLDQTKAARGKPLYDLSCTACHGAKGLGDGPAAIALHPRPKDFSQRIFETSYLGRILKEGIPGSAMPPFPHFTEEEIENLSHYLAGFYDEE